MKGFCEAFKSEVPPEPPFLEADLCPIDHSRRSPRPRLGNPERRPTGWISRSIGGGASSTECQQSYGMQPEIERSSFAGDLNRQIVREHISFLVRDTARFGSRHVGAIADGVYILPFC